MEGREIGRLSLSRHTGQAPGPGTRPRRRGGAVVPPPIPPFLMTSVCIPRQSGSVLITCSFHFSVPFTDLYLQSESEKMISFTFSQDDPPSARLSPPPLMDERPTSSFASANFMKYCLELI